MSKKNNNDKHFHCEIFTLGKVIVRGSYYILYNIFFNNSTLLFTSIVVFFIVVGVHRVETVRKLILRRVQHNANATRCNFFTCIRNGSARCTIVALLGIANYLDDYDDDNGHWQEMAILNCVRVETRLHDSLSLSLGASCVCNYLIST